MEKIQIPLTELECKNPEVYRKIVRFAGKPDPVKQAETIRMRVMKTTGKPKVFYHPSVTGLDHVKIVIGHAGCYIKVEFKNPTRSIEKAKECVNEIVRSFRNLSVKPYQAFLQ